MIYLTDFSQIPVIPGTSFLIGFDCPGIQNAKLSSAMKCQYQKTGKWWAIQDLNL